jgi:parvulin-like peptidyl-prolyl isomerase
MRFQFFEMKAVKYFLLICSVITLSRCSQENYKNDPAVLALVGRQTITREQFIDRIHYITKRMNFTDNMETRLQVLNGLIEEDLLIAEAGYRGLDSDSASKQEYERIKIQEVLNSFNRKFILSTVTMNDDELKKLYVDFNTKILARHLYAPTKQQADSLYNLLQHGAAFEKLAAENFNDPVLREAGGSLGYFSVDEMDPAFEEAAFALGIGETSKPVRTINGYSIIRVDDRWTKPIITETEFAQKRPQLEAYWFKRKTVQATQKYVDSLRHNLNITFNEPLVQDFYSELRQKQKQYGIEQNQLMVTGNDKWNNQIVLSSNAGDWDMTAFRQYAQFTSPVQQNWIHTEENLKDFIAGLFVRSYILKQAREAGLDATSDYKQRVTKEFNNYLLESMENHILQDMEIPQDSLLSYYNDDPQRLALPAKVHLREIVLNDKGNVDLITGKLNQGASFADLARKYSVRRRSGIDGGDLGYLTPEDLGSWAGQIFSLQPNDWRGPFRSDSMYVFLQCVDKIPSQPRTFESAREDIKETIRNIWWGRERDRVLSRIRSRVKVISYSDKLKNFRIN